MPSANEFSTTPATNTTIGGVNVGEDCAPGGLNDAIRYLAAVARDTYDRVPAAGAFVPTTGGNVGPLIRQGQGAYLSHAGSAQTSGMVYFLPEGSPRPTAAEGTIVFYYS